MALDFQDLDLQSVVDEMENIMHGTKNLKIDKDDSSYFGHSRVTASGFTDNGTEFSNVIRMSDKDIADRKKIARDTSSMLRLLEFSPEDRLYLDDLIVRFSSSNGIREPDDVHLKDMMMLKVLTERTKNEVNDIANEMMNDAREFKRIFKESILPNPFKRKNKSDGQARMDAAKSNVIEGLKNLNPHPSSAHAYASESDEDTVVTKPLTIAKSRRDSVVGSTVYADDSISQIGKLRRRNATELRVKRSQVDSTVVGGYKPTLSALDEDEDVEITPVLGLPKVFVNDRLNFLCHLHKPLLELLSEGDVYPVTDILPRLERFMKKHRGREREPEANLLYMVIKHTFSLSRMQVRENSFQLPLLETGMYIDEELIYMSIEQLYSEYSLQWFSSMKAISVPKFHNKYKDAMKGTRSQRAGTQKESESKRRQSRSFVNFPM